MRIKLVSIGSATLLAVVALPLLADDRGLALGSQEAGSTTSKPMGPWTDGTFLPNAAKSVHILKSDEPILIEPRSGAPRRGSAGLERHLPLFSVREGSGCQSAWLGVGPHAWICGDHVEVSAEEPIAADAHTLEGGSDGLPYRYYFVGPDGSLGYRNLRDADAGQPDFEFQTGFAVAIVDERNAGGQHYGRTGNEMWVPMRDLGPAHPLAFQGAEVPAGETTIPFGWVVTSSARVFSGPSSARITSESIAEFVRVDVFEEQGTFDKLTRIGDGRWVHSSDIRHPTVAPPPVEVDLASKERWIDVDIATQTLVLYEGESPVFATLVSTGKGNKGAYNATPTGTFRVWAKLTSANMDNLEDENAAHYYRMETVPWVQFFSKGVGLHGAFWHHSFGHQRSHGCVNLTPLDAERAFYFTSPRIPAGWTAILPTAAEQGTVVRVR